MLRGNIATLSAIVAMSFAAGCGVPKTTVRPAPRAVEVAAPAVVPSGFLDDEITLKPLPDSPGLEVYRTGTIAAHRQLYVGPIHIWRSTDPGFEQISEEDLQYLAGAFYRAIVKQLGDAFTIETKPTPGALEMHLALTFVTDASLPVDFFSAAVPVPNLAPREGWLVGATRRFVRGCAVEVELADRSKGSKAVLAAVFDGRRDAQSPKGSVVSWEELHAGLQSWAKELDANLQTPKGSSGTSSGR